MRIDACKYCVLRHGFKFYGKIFRMAYFKPAYGLNEAVLALYAQNRLTVTRQQTLCHPGSHETVDMEFQGAAFPIIAREIFETIRLGDESEKRTG